MICTLPRDTLQLASHFCIAVLLSYPSLLSILPSGQPTLFRFVPQLISILPIFVLRSESTSIAVSWTPTPRPSTASLAFLVVLADPGGDLPPFFPQKACFFPPCGSCHFYFRLFLYL